jgi:glutamate 5-kinase
LSILALLTNTLDNTQINTLKRDHLTYKRIIIKIGSNVLTQSDGLTDVARMQHLVEQVAAFMKQGVEVVLVSSGAVAAGRSLVSVDEKINAVAARQLLASVGQVRLINIYAQLFGECDLLCSQVLVTREDFRDRLHYLNMKNCLEILLQKKVIPIVNENDVVAVTELMFTDNDELAGLIASMLAAEALLILSNVDGIYDGDPRLPGSKVIEQLDADKDLSSFVTTGKSTFGRGGMLTKAAMAQKISRLGIQVHIANGKKQNVLEEWMKGTLVHTQFVAKKSQSGKKRWIAHAADLATGVAVINQGAEISLRSDKATSLLPVGVTKLEGDFAKGDIIRLVNEDGEQVGLGIAEYSIEKAKERIGKKNQRPLVHYDYLSLNT